MKPSNELEAILAQYQAAARELSAAWKDPSLSVADREAIAERAIRLAKEYMACQPNTSEYHAGKNPSREGQPYSRTYLTKEEIRVENRKRDDEYNRGPRVGPWSN